MHSIEEKRVYGDREGATEAYVSSSIGVVRVRVAGDTVGEFGLCDRCTAHDVAAADGIVAVATDEDVRLLVPPAEDDESAADDPPITETGFGPAVAVGLDDAGLLAASPDGEIARLAGDVPADDGDWESLESAGIGAVRAIDGDLVGTEDGVYRVHEAGLDHAGLSAVRDVSAAGVPLAATDDGLYKLGNGWMQVLEGPFDVVAADPQSEPGRLARAHAVSGETVYAYGENDWQVYDRSSTPVVGFGYGETCYAVTERGTFLSATPDDGNGPWRSRTLGIGDVTGLAVLR
ncbi:HVO_0234 family beta-propeller protein [Natronorubrum aibiense]|uniref:HVO-0234-like beta-propeller domain-containing protein n=1 Tax=Natronorubrum aibiense TaxID=348826 RepID=A0A5P9P278_9EURY|nr:hypothetical protein [Natronorubrum aibiense]QFU82232.1 hypothetical protein GCU68_06650 [Natronorubrum aibiense]